MAAHGPAPLGFIFQDQQPVLRARVEATVPDEMKDVIHSLP
jgi:hypothetical protein